MRRTVIGMLTYGWLATGLAGAASLDIDSLPELPKELADQLTELPNTKMLVTASGGTQLPLELSLGENKLFDERECFCSYGTYAQVIFPVTICVPTVELPDRLIPSVLDEEIYYAKTAEAGYKQFQLKTWRGEPLAKKYYCSQRSGPWVAEVRQVIGCDSSRTWTTQILGVPSMPFFLWFGDFSEHPPELQFVAGPDFPACSTCCAKCRPNQLTRCS